VQLEEPAQAALGFREAFRARAVRARCSSTCRSTCSAAPASTTLRPCGRRPLPIEVPVATGAADRRGRADAAGGRAADHPCRRRGHRRGGSDELRQLAEYLQVPVQVTPPCATAPGVRRRSTRPGSGCATLRRRDDFDDVPIKPRRVFREINRSLRPDTTFVTASGLYQIWSGQFQQTFEPRRYLVCGQAGPLGDNSFQCLMEEIAVSPRPSWGRRTTEAAAGTERPPRPAGPARGPFCMLRPRSTDARRP
jgi:hypothetical protein